MNTSDFLRIAIHKSGPLNEKSIKLLKDCGLKFDNSLDKLRAYSNESKIELVFFRQEDIPGFVSDGDVDAGIVGREVFEESGKHVKLLNVQLNLSHCKLAILVPSSSNFNNITDLENKRIATSYPGILVNKLAEYNTKAKIQEISQETVQLTSFLGIADAIFDKIADENTLAFSGLKPLPFSGENFNTIIIYQPNLPKSKLSILEKLQTKINAVLEGTTNKYIVMNAPKGALNEILQILPSLESPTIVELHKIGWVAIHTVIEENDFWEKIDLLILAGAEGIIVMPIEKMIIK